MENEVNTIHMQYPDEVQEAMAKAMNAIADGSCYEPAKMRDEYIWIDLFRVILPKHNCAGKETVNSAASATDYALAAFRARYPDA